MSHQTILQIKKKLANLTTKIIFIAFSLFTIIYTSISPQQLTYAANPDFELATTFTIKYKNNTDYVTVTKKLKIIVNTKRYYYPAGENNIIHMPQYSIVPSNTEKAYKKDSLKVYKNGSETSDYTLTEDSLGYSVNIPQHTDINYRSNYQLSIKYKTHELIDLNGNLKEIYIPGLDKDISMEDKNSNGTTTKYSYTSYVQVPSSFPDASYTNPKPDHIKTDNEKDTYTFMGKTLIGKTGWIQFGNIQYTHFKLTQKTPKSESWIPPAISAMSDLLSTNVYEIALPREYAETNQKIYYKEINPPPVKIKQDNEGNLIAVFEIPSTENGVITIDGYFVTQKPKTSIPEVSLDEYYSIVKNDPQLQTYLTPDLYWQVNNPDIQKIASELKKGKKNINDLIKADYNYVIDKIEYDDSKLENNNNFRLGAIKAIADGHGVCMEYSDALLTILRAQGIPTRASIGYGNDPTKNDSNLDVSLESDKSDKSHANSDNNQTKDTNQLPKNAVTYSHQWVQIWIPKYGWLSVDPTWGETGREFIGGDLDHILWYTIAKVSDSINETAFYSAYNRNYSSTILQTSTLVIETLSEQNMPKLENLHELQELVIESNITDSTKNEDGDNNQSTNAQQTQKILENIEFYIKTTTIGQALILFIPSCALFIIFIFFFVVLFRILKVRRKKNKKSEDYKKEKQLQKTNSPQN